jgi:hypothetical protein
METNRKFKPWYGTEEELRSFTNKEYWTEKRIQATIALAKMQEEYEALEAKMIDLALEHELSLTLGQDKNGQRSLIHQHDLEGEYALDTYKQPGQWLTSTEACS